MSPARRSLALPCHAVLLWVAALLGLAAFAAPAASAAPGDLDPTFAGGAGTERFFLSEEKIRLRAVATQPDGKIVLAGFEDPGSVVVVRLLADGGFDPSFGVEGKVTTPFPGAGNFGEARAVAVQPDGKIVIAGSAKGAVEPDFLVARYEADGTPDPTFGGGDGIEILPVGTKADSAEAIAIGIGGRIFLTGESRLPGGGTAAGVAVLQPDGKPDPAFSTDGVQLVQVTGGEESDHGEDIVEQPDGRILIADSTGNGAGNGFTLVRLLASGTPDPSFDGDGIVNTPMPSAANPGAKGRVTGIALQPEGRIVAVGYGFDETGPSMTVDSKFAAARYLEDGKLDVGFGGGTGIFTLQVGEGEDSARAIALTPSGQILLAGSYDAAPSIDSPAVLRLRTDGTLDSAFGSSGVVRRGATARFGEIFQDAALDPEERLVLLSTSFEGNNMTQVVVTRLLGDKQPLIATPENQPPHARILRLAKKIRAAKMKRFAGLAADADGTVAKVQIAVIGKLAVGKGKAKARVCLVMKNAKAKLKRVRLRKGKPCPQRWLAAKGTTRWSFRLKRQLPPGRYVVFARAIDDQGAFETRFSRKLGNRRAFRVLP